MSSQHRAIVHMLLCAMLWSIGGMLIKLIPWNAFAIAGFRSLIAGFVLLAYMRLQRVPLRWNRHTLLVSIGLAGTLLCFVSATKLTTAANAVVIQYAAPLYLLLYGVLFRGQRFRAADLAVVLAAGLGISVFFFDKLGGGTAAGNLVALLSGLFFAMIFITTGGAEETDRLNGLLQGQLLTALIGVPFFFAAPAPVSLESVLCILALGLFQLGLSYVLYTLALRACPPLACSLLATIEPLLNPLWVFLFVGEAPGPFSLIGGVIVIAAVTLWCVYNEKHPPVPATGEEA